MFFSLASFRHLAELLLFVSISSSETYTKTWFRCIASTYHGPRNFAFAVALATYKLHYAQKRPSGNPNSVCDANKGLSLVPEDTQEASLKRPCINSSNPAEVWPDLSGRTFIPDVEGLFTRCTLTELLTLVDRCWSISCQWQICC